MKVHLDAGSVSRARRRLRGLATVVMGCLFAGMIPSPPAQAAQSFIARIDRAQVPLDDSFIFEVTLVVDGGQASGYHSPPFKDFRLLGEQPSQSHQFRMGPGGTFNQTVFSWRYELQPLKTGNFTIGPARVLIGGNLMSTEPVNVTVLDAVGGARRAPPPVRSPFSRGPFSAPPRQAPVPVDSGGANFLRVVPSKNRAFVGEQITVEWWLYLTERQDRYQPSKEPRTDGFWVEDLPNPMSARGLSLSPQMFEGRSYLTAPLLRKALFPLRSGSLVITPLESEIAQVDFFGTDVRTETLKAPLVTIEVLPLPAAGRPADFDDTAVGQFSLSASVDRSEVMVGEAVTLTVRLTGTGNLRKIAIPPLPRLGGWKPYEPKVTVSSNPTGDAIGGEKTVEVLLLPEQIGVTTIPPVEIAFFDPAARTYGRARSQPVTITVGGVGSGVDGGAPALAAGPSVATRQATAEALLASELRPIRARGGLRRNFGAGFHRSRVFSTIVAVPPMALFATWLVGRVRIRFGRETERGKNRQLRRLARQRLSAALRHLRHGARADFFIEIDRVLRELLAGRLRRPVAGMSRDELRATLVGAGLSSEAVVRLIDALEECDRARFAPGSVDDDAMSAALERASDSILQIEKIKVRSATADLKDAATPDVRTDA